MTDQPANDLAYEVSRLGVEPSYYWQGRARVNITDRDLLGDAEVSCDTNAIRLDIKDGVGNWRDFDALTGLPSGAIIPDNSYGTAEADDKDWIAEQVLENGYASKLQGGAYVTTRSFVAQRLTVVGESVSRPAAIHRYVYQGGSIPYATRRTELSDGSVALDLFESSFNRRQMLLRQIGSPVDPQRRTLVATFGSPKALNDNELTTLWLGLSYLNGARIKPLYHEAFDDAGKLICREYQLGAEVGTRLASPFDRAARPSPSQVTDLLDGIYKLNIANFPIHIILGHLFDAIGARIETSIMHLVFGVQVAVEATLRERSAYENVSHEEWRRTSAALLDAVGDILDGVPPSVQMSVRGRLASANVKGFRARVHDALDALAIKLTADTEWALSLRNMLFHRGYIWRDFSSLSGRDKARYYDASARLMDLLNAIALRHIGFHGAYSSARSLDVLDLGSQVLNL